MRKEATKKEWNKLYELALKYKEQKPWEKFWDMDLFSIKFSAKEIGFFSIMGKGGECIGLNLYIGEEGFNDLLRLISIESLNIQTEYAMYEQNYISLYMGDRDEVSKEQYQVIKDLGLKFRGKGNWLYFETYETGYIPYLPNKEEVLVFTKYLEQLLCAIEYFEQYQCKVDFEHGELFEYAMNHGTWSGNAAMAPFFEYQIPQLALTNELERARLKKAAKKKWNGVLEMDIFYMQEMVTDKEFDKPFVPKIALMADHKSGMMLMQTLLTPVDNDQDAFANMLISWILEQGAPQKVIVENLVMHALLKDICRICGIKLEVDWLERIDECKDLMNGFDGGQPFGDLGDEFSDEEAEAFMNLLGSMGVDMGDWNEKALTMSEEDFTESLMGQMIESMERLGFSKEELIEEMENIDWEDIDE